MNFEIKTKRLTLRPPLEKDDIRLFQLMSEPDLTTFLTWSPHENIQTTQVLIDNLINAQINDKGYHWCVCKDDVVIGLVSLIDVRRKVRTWIQNRAEISYWISGNYQSNGYATEAVKAIIDFGFSYLKFHKLIIAHALENVQSQRICDKFGFIKYAHEHDAFFKNGKWHDLLWYEQFNTYK